MVTCSTQSVTVTFTLRTESKNVFIVCMKYDSPEIVTTCTIVTLVLLEICYFWLILQKSKTQQHFELNRHQQCCILFMRFMNFTEHAFQVLPCPIIISIFGHGLKSYGVDKVGSLIEDLICFDWKSDLFHQVLIS